MARTTAARSVRARARGIQGPAMGSGTFTPGEEDVKTERRKDGKTERRGADALPRVDCQSLDSAMAFHLPSFRPSAPPSPLRRDAVGGLRRVVLEAEVIVDGALQIVVAGEAGMELLRVSGLDEDVAVGKVEAGQHHQASLAALQLDDDGVVHGGDDADVGIREIVGDGIVATVNDTV